MTDLIRDLDVVVLTRALRGWDGHAQEREFEAGERGTVVHVYPECAGFEVEFVNADGETTGVLTVERDALRLATAEELRVAA